MSVLTKLRLLPVCKVEYGVLDEPLVSDETRQQAIVERVHPERDPPAQTGKWSASKENEPEAVHIASSDDVLYDGVDGAGAVPRRVEGD